MIACDHLLKAVPYRIHTILADNGIQFAERPRNRNTAWSRQMRFDMICDAREESGVAVGVVDRHRVAAG